MYWENRRYQEVGKGVYTPNCILKQKNIYQLESKAKYANISKKIYTFH